MSTADLVTKLKLAKYPRKLVLGQPESVNELAALTVDHTPTAPPYDLVMAFVFSLQEMAQVIAQADTGHLVSPDGRFYLVYPKKGNKAYAAEIGRDDIFPYLKVSMETGIIADRPFKFNSMAAFNETFTVIGLKPVVEKAKR